jgi:hypothetical protein
MPKINFFIPVFISLLACYTLQGQDTTQKVPITEVLNKISESHAVTFNYESSLLQDLKVFPPQEKLKLSDKLKDLERQTNLTFNRISDMVIAVSKAIRLCGYVENGRTGEPLEGATIQSNSQYTISDKNGYFEIPLSSLEDLIIIRHIGFKTIKRQARFFNLERCDSIKLLEQQEMMTPILIDAYLVRGIDKKQDWSTSIDYKRFSLLPGLIESDVLQTVQALPSVLSVDETVSNLNIRGGSHDQNLILWDDIKMYQTGQFFGLISSFNPHMTQTASVLNNGTDVTFTDGVSGTIHMQTDQDLNSKFKGTFGLNFLNAELFTDIPIGQKSSLQIASRKSIDDFVRTPTYEVYFDRVTQATEAETNISEVTNSNQDFNFFDTSLRWLYKPSENDVIRLNFILTNSDLSFNETASIEDALQTKESSVSQNSVAAGLHYKRQWNNELATNLAIYNSEYKLQAINANVLEGQLFLQENVVSETSVKLENIYRKNLWKLKLGYSFTETEVINLNDVDLPRFVRRDEEILREHGAFGQAWYTSSNNDFSVRGGMRVNYLTKFDKLIIEPRLSLRKAIGNHIQIEALGEFKHQNTSQIVNFQNDFLGIEKRRWQLTDNDSIPIIQSKQASVGIMYKNGGWLFDAKAYYKNVNGITTQSQEFTTKYEFEKEKGQYDAYGFELLCRKKFKNLNSWLSYSYINNTYTFEALEEIEFPSNFDITHSITLGSTFSNESWNISAGLNYRTGRPTSIPLAGNEIENNSVNFDSANNRRLPYYMRVDASAIYKLRISDAFRSEIGASVWNITNRENTISNYFRIGENDTVNGFSRFSLGLTTNAVIRIYF